MASTKISLFKEKVMDILKLRSNYQVLNKGAYLMNAAVGAMHSGVYRAGLDMWSFMNELGDIEDERYFGLMEDSLTCVSKSLGIHSHDLAFNPNTSHNINLIAMMLKEKNTKREIVIPEDEFPSSIIPFYHHDFKIKSVASVEGEIRIEDILHQVCENTSAVVVSAIQFLTGYRMNLIELGQELHRRNIPFIVNGTQMLGAFKIPFKEAKIKAFSASVHKWYGAGFGMALFMTSEDFREGVKWPLAGWTSVVDPSLMTSEPPTMRTDTSATQTGCISFLNLAAVREASKVIDFYGQENISERLLSISIYLEEQLRTVPIKINSFRKREDACSGTINFSPIDKSLSTEELVGKLHMDKVYVNDRRGSIRASAHFYNTHEDIDCLVSSLKKILV